MLPVPTVPESAVDSAWRWRTGVENLYLYRFYGQAIRFVSTGRLLGQTPRFNLVTDKRVYTLGERIAIDAHDCAGLVGLAVAGFCFATQRCGRG